MIIASAITGGLVYAVYPEWTFWQAWLVGARSAFPNPNAEDPTPNPNADPTQA